MISTILQDLSEGTGKEVVLTLTQPLTAYQLARRLAMRPEQCSALLERLAAIGVIRCLNPFARSSRVFWHTFIGQEFQAELLRRNKGEAHVYRLPKINWRLYGSVCFSHRATVIKTVTRPMQPAEIKRHARFANPNMRMSANNVRDVIQYLKRQGIARPVEVKKRAHPCYDLTDQGRQFQQLLQQAEVKHDCCG